jgi:gamma-glutamyltranspeptidase/glutathione hydrolase
MLDKGYLAQRAALIGERPWAALPTARRTRMQVAWGADTAIDKPSTSHLVAVDAYGGGLSMTTSVEDAFGARQMVDGFMLNNQLTDFSFDSRDADGPIANRVQAGKRPRSAMSPTLVFEKGTHKLVLATGSPGGYHHQLRGQGAGRDAGLGPRCAAGHQPAQHRQPQRPDRAGSGPRQPRGGRTAQGARPRYPRIRPELRPAGHPAARVNGKAEWFGGADPRAKVSY